MVPIPPSPCWVIVVTVPGPLVDRRGGTRTTSSSLLTMTVCCTHIAEMTSPSVLVDVLDVVECGMAAFQAHAAHRWLAEASWPERPRPAGVGRAAAGLLRPVRRRVSVAGRGGRRRVHQMQAHLAHALSAAEPARAVLGEDGGVRTDPAPIGPNDPDDFIYPGCRAWGRNDGLSGAAPGPRRLRSARPAQAAFDRLVSKFSLTTVLRDVVLPFLADLGFGGSGDGKVARNGTFASDVHPGAQAAPGLGNGHGPRAVLACPQERRPGADDLGVRPRPHRSPIDLGGPRSRS